MQRSFSCDELNLLTRVVHKACIELGGCDEPTHDVIALRVLTYYADSGERDFDVLLSIATGVKAREASDAR